MDCFIEDKIGICRATVYGLWITQHPFRVSSGYITKDTKVRDDILALLVTKNLLLDCFSFVECMLYNISTNVEGNVGFRSPR